MHQPPPPSVPPVRLAAPVVAMAKALPKAAPKPPPKKGLNVPYDSYPNIRAVVKHFEGCLAIEQHGMGDVNVCPWSRLKGVGPCPWRAGRHLGPTRSTPGIVSTTWQRTMGRT